MINVDNRTIFCKDNLDILRGINTESIDLIYLDPPFNKNKEFTAPIGSSDEGASFKDYFREEDVKDEWVQNIKEDYEGLYKYLNSIKELSSIINTTRNKHYLYNYCYLCYMAIRLIEMRRILKNTGSIYFHCDPTMSHYLKIMMDIIFGEKNFRNEIVWHYKKWSNITKDFQKNHDIILRYVKTNKFIFHIQYQDYANEKWIENTIRIRDKNNKLVRAKDEQGNYIERKVKRPGVVMHDVLDNISWGATNKERTSYPTQKPRVLLERIIQASSNKEDIVLDPFCGCATTCIAAEKLDRKWIGIDVSIKAYEFVKKRLEKEIKKNTENSKSLLSDLYEINFKTDPPKRTDLIGDEDEKRYVYVISNPAFEGLYKVGIAKDCEMRLNSYQTSDPDRGYKIEFKFHTCLYREIEKHIHKTFINKHEWVKGDLKTIIQSIKNFGN